MKRRKPKKVWWTIVGDTKVLFLPSGIIILLFVLGFALFGDAKVDLDFWVFSICGSAFTAFGFWRLLVVWRIARHGVRTTARPVGRGWTYRGRLTDIEFEYTYEGKTYQTSVPMHVDEATKLRAEGVPVIVDPKEPTRIIVVDDMDILEDRAALDSEKQI